MMPPMDGISGSITRTISRGARDELQSFVTAPDVAAVPRRRQGRRRRSASEQQEQLEKQFRKNDRRVADLWAYPGFRRRPLTLTMVAVCVSSFSCSNRSGDPTSSTGSCSPAYYVDETGQLDDGLGTLRQGEIWRLVTPIFMHAGVPCTYSSICGGWFISGTMIEVRRGTPRLTALVLISAIVSNSGQFMWMERTLPGKPHFFLGMSGVVYALFGYIWMKSLYEPEQGIFDSPQ